MSNDNNEHRTFVSGTIFYNDVKSLERTLESLHDKMDYMICVDGKFKHYEDKDCKDGLSYDGSRELVKSYDNAILIDIPNSFEIQKRQAYLDYCDKINADYLLIVDSDEYVINSETNFDRFQHFCKLVIEGQYKGVYNVFAVLTEVNSPHYDHIVHKITGTNNPTLSIENKQFAHHPRLWYKPGQMMYNGTHYYFVNKNPNHPTSFNKQETCAAVWIVPELKLGHDHTLRSQKHLEGRLGYQKRLVNFEQRKLKHYKEIHRQFPSIDQYNKIDESNEYDNYHVPYSLPGYS